MGAFTLRDSWSKRVPTAALNRWFDDALAANPPPAPGGRRIKLRYITQAGYPVIPPFACRNHAPVKRQDQRKLGPVKRHLFRRAVHLGDVRRLGRRDMQRHDLTVAEAQAQIKP